MSRVQVPSLTPNDPLLRSRADIGRARWCWSFRLSAWALAEAHWGASARIASLTSLSEFGVPRVAVIARRLSVARLPQPDRIPVTLCNLATGSTPTVHLTMRHSLAKRTGAVHSENRCGFAPKSPALGPRHATIVSCGGGLLVETGSDLTAQRVDRRNLSEPAPLEVLERL